jgi:acyl-CoA synthetase (AMP-forming)/AMP-acid ligase II/acyl carrier protein
MNYADYARLHARHLPDKVCLVERTPSKNQRRTLTWRQFNAEINRVANYLSKELGIKDGDTVLHLQNNSLEWIITYYGIIKLGAVVVPLNFRFVGRDVLYAAGSCNPRAFILGSEFLPVVRPIRKELKMVESYICVGDDAPDDMIDYRAIAARSDIAEAVVDVDDQHALAIMFTAGTSGDAKPVLHTHHSLNHTAIANGLSYFVERNDNYLFFLPLYHSGTMFLWAPFFATGAAGTLLREFSDPRWIIEAIAAEKATDVLFVVPVAIDLLNSIEKGRLNLADYDLTAWRYLEIGAQPVPFAVLKRLVDALPCGVSNIYGITEAGGGGLFNLYPEEALKKPGSIGKPTFGVEAKVVDDAGREMGPGKIGELVIRTGRMMKGYFGEPETTASVLKDGWLYTGDLTTADDQGYYFIVDRAKDIIITGGENIFPEEIETVLTEHPKIQDAACIGYPDERLVEVVLAVVQLKEGASMTAEELIGFARSKLALYKVPRRVIFDRVLRDPGGKLMKPEMRQKYTGRKEAFQRLDRPESCRRRPADGQALRAAFSGGDFLRQLEKADPYGHDEMLMDHIRSEVRSALRIEAAVEIKDDQGLTDLGMTSCMALELNSRLMQSIGCALPTTLFFDYPTVAAIAGYLKTRIAPLAAGGNLDEPGGQVKAVSKPNRENPEAPEADDDVEEALARELEKAGY